MESLVLRAKLRECPHCRTQSLSLCLAVPQVLTARPLVDTQAPPTFCHLRLKVKRLKVGIQVLPSAATCLGRYSSRHSKGHTGHW